MQKRSRQGRLVVDRGCSGYNDLEKPRSRAQGEAMLIETITMPDFERGVRRTQTVLILVGSVEEHGAHLPLATDTIEVYEWAKRVARAVDVFIAPPFP